MLNDRGQHPWRLHDAWHYRLRAEEMRTAADNMKDETCRRTAYRLADDYERMASHIESLAKPKEGK